MKVNEIERLLARYYDGETSETEEKDLNEYLQLTAKKEMNNNLKIKGQ